jgi:hypothetical protein
MRSRAALLGCTSGFLLAACGGDERDTTITEAGTPGMRATVDGAAWTSTVAPSTVTNNQLLILNGSDGTTRITIGVSPAIAPRSFALLAGGGSSAIVGRDSAAWSTNAPGGSGTVRITSITPTRVAGTFSFVAPAAGGGATGTRRVAGGTFDVAR